MNRRQFVCRSAFGVAGVAMAASLPDIAFGASVNKIPLGLQLWSIREQCAKDLPASLQAVSKIGYKGVEFAGYHGRSAEELRKLLDENGLVTCGSHTPYESFAADKLAATIEFNHAIGNRFLIVPWMENKTRQQWLDKASEFNELADKLKPHGMKIGYHAHAHDFEKFGGETAWDIFFSNTKPEVIMQLDTGNCCEGGAEPVAVLKKYPGRARTIHIKAYGGGPNSVIGEDKVDWKGVFTFCEGPGKTEWYVLEHETAKDSLDAAKRSYEALKKMGEV